MSIARAAWCCQMRRFQRLGRRPLPYAEWQKWMGAGCAKYWETQ